MTRAERAAEQRRLARLAMIQRYQAAVAEADAAPAYVPLPTTQELATRKADCEAQIAALTTASAAEQNTSVKAMLDGAIVSAQECVAEAESLERVLAGTATADDLAVKAKLKASYDSQIAEMREWLAENV